MSRKRFDLVVLGGGPGGYVAAIRAAQLGLETALVERDRLGGVCLNWGCIPTKALLRSAEVFEHLKHAGDFGLSARDVGFDLARVVKRSRDVAARLNAGVRHLLDKNRVDVFEGHGRLGKPGTLVVQGKTGILELESPHIVLATGARVRSIPPIEPDGRLVWSYREAMTPDRMPASVLVAGSGAIGVEFASFYRSMGAEVTVVEVLERILPVEDAEVSEFARKAFERRGMKIHTSAVVKALDKGSNHVVATVESGGGLLELKAERAIAAVGIVGNVENLGIEGTRVEVRDTHVVTDEWCRTGEPGIYAIGDVAGGPWLAHKASHEGILCVERIAGSKNARPLDRTRIPGCTYSRPQIASIGLTEARARELGHPVRVGRFPFLGNGKAIALGEPEGFVKTVFDAVTGELLGAHLAGPEVTELVQGFSIGKTLETTEMELMHTIFPHPTLSEAMHETTLAAYERAIHI